MRREHREMKFRQLEHLIALAEERHFGKAAERVHLSQPAFSRSIQALELTTNLRLFDREAGDVRPTPACEFLLARARSIQFAMRGLERDIALYSKAELGKLAFGVGPFPAAMLLHQVVPSLRRQFPQLQLQLEVHNWQLLLELLRDEHIEFFVADSQDFSSTDLDIEIEALTKVSAGFFVHPDHPLLGKIVSMQDLMQFGLATTRLPQEVRMKVAAAFGLSLSQQLPLVLECDDVALLRTVAKGSDTILGVIHGSIRADLASGELIELAIEDKPALFSSLGLVSLKDRSRSPAATEVISKIKVAIAEF
jgi:DNA-binding transcriptional LysR family regulator